MQGMKIAPRALVAALALGAAACSDENPAGPLPGDAVPGESRAQAAPVRSIEDHFAALATQVPGFGGYYHDDAGNLVVYLTDLSQRGTARAALAPVLRAANAGVRGGRAAQPEIVARQAEYDFTQLREWSGRLLPVLSVAGVVYTDLDEASNRLAVGVETPAARPQVEARVAALGIPAAAVAIVETAPIRPLATLRDYVRGTQGGLQIAYSSYVCTLGFNAYSGSTRSYLTNSHCTSTQGGVESTKHYQPTTSSSSYFIGTEVADPAYWTGGSCPSGRRCRYSDSSRGAYSSSVAVDYGYIARTTSYGTSSGSLTIDSSNPRFKINAEKAYPSVGEYLDKIGRTTGWTYGKVTKTCFHVNVSGTDITQLCQEEVGAGSNGGDSGSPVFYWSGSGSYVTLYGLLWGGGSGSYIFSSMNNIEYELGGLGTY